MSCRWAGAGVFSCRQYHAPVVIPADVDLIFPGRAGQTTFRVGEEGLDYLAAVQLDVIHRMAAQVGDVVHHAVGPVIVLFRLLGGDEDLFGAQGVDGALVLGAGRDPVAYVDWPDRLRTFDDSMVCHVGDDLVCADVHAADEFSDVALDRALVDVRRRAELDDPALIHDGDALGHGHGLFLIVGDHDAGHA